LIITAHVKNLKTSATLDTGIASNKDLYLKTWLEQCNRN